MVLFKLKILFFFRFFRFIFFGGFFIIYVSLEEDLRVLVGFLENGRGFFLFV